MGSLTGAGGGGDKGSSERCRMGAYSEVSVQLAGGTVPEWVAVQLAIQP